MIGFFVAINTTPPRSLQDHLSLLLVDLEKMRDEPLPGGPRIGPHVLSPRGRQARAGRHLVWFVSAMDELSKLEVGADSGSINRLAESMSKAAEAIHRAGKIEAVIDSLPSDDGATVIARSSLAAILEHGEVAALPIATLLTQQNSFKAVQSKWGVLYQNYLESNVHLVETEQLQEQDEEQESVDQPTLGSKEKKEKSTENTEIRKSPPVSLTRGELSILGVLSRFSTRTLLIQDILEKIRRNPAEATVKKHVRRLIEHGLAERPRGPKSAVQITARGQELVRRPAKILPKAKRNPNKNGSRSPF